MYRKQLEQACAKGIIHADQLEPLLNFLNDTQAPSEPSDNDEPLRFVRSFGDIFITLGVVFVAVSAAQLGIEGYFNIIPVLCFTATAEWLVKARRLALPGIALLIAILYFSNQIIDFDNNLQYSNHVMFFKSNSAINLALPILVNALFYWRYRMPFSLLPLSLFIIAFITLAIDFDLSQYQFIFCFYGFTVFTVAMWFDIRDTARVNRNSDCGFWLHLLAAPLVVHGIMFSLLQISDQTLPIKELMMMLFFFIFFLVALFVDRRALLISSLSYAIYAIIEIAGNNLFKIENLTFFIFMAFGVFIVFFGVYWHRTRHFIFAKLSGSVIMNYVPALKTI